MWFLLQRDHHRDASEPIRTDFIFERPGTWWPCRRSVPHVVGCERGEADASGGAPSRDQPAPVALHRYAITSSAGSDILRRLIGNFDGYLSQRCGVRPYSRDARCLLRCATIPAPGAFTLSDGTVVRPGDLLIDLHLWNEHIPPVPAAGPDLAWARLVAAWMRRSLNLLAGALDADPALHGARAIRAKTNFVGWNERGESLSRLIARFGFEDVDEPSSLPGRVHDAFENVLIGALTWTHNPEALRRDRMVRRRRPVWMSADALRRHHGG